MGRRMPSQRFRFTYPQSVTRSCQADLAAGCVPDGDNAIAVRQVLREAIVRTPRVRRPLDIARCNRTAIHV